jgi:hypothetical protein
MIRLLAHPLPPCPVSKLSLFLSLPNVAPRAYFTERERGGGGGGRGIQSYECEKDWPSINPSIFSVPEQCPGDRGLALHTPAIRASNVKQRPFLASRRMALSFERPR